MTDIGAATRSYGVLIASIANDLSQFFSETILNSEKILDSKTATELFPPNIKRLEKLF